MPTAHHWSEQQRNLLASDLLTPATKKALVERIQMPTVVTPRYFTPSAFALLCAVCGRLVPQRVDDGTTPGRHVDIAGEIDARLADGGGNGWRYAVLPVDGEAYRAALLAIDDQAQQRLARPFAELSAGDQDALLDLLQRGEIALGTAEAARRCFEELLAEATEIYYSHPSVQARIGYAGMADAAGWQAIGLDQRASWEPHRMRQSDV